MRAAPHIGDAIEAFEQAWHGFGRNTDTGIAHDQIRNTLTLANGDADGAFKCKLKRIGKEIEDDLLPHVAIDVRWLIERRTIDVQNQPRPLGRRAKRTRQFGRKGGQVGRFIARLHPSGFNAGKIEQAVDKTQQAQPVAVHDFQLTFGGGGEIGMTL